MAVPAIVDIDVICKLTRLSQLDAFQKYLRDRNLTALLQPSIDATLDLDNRRGIVHLLASQEQKATVAAFARGVGRVELNERGQELIELCHLVEDVDPGDAIWLAAAASMPDCVVFTGDKRALRAVCGAEACAPIVQAISGRVVCLEQIILELFDPSYVMLRAAVREDPAADAVIANAFPAKATPKAEATAALLAEVEKLRRETGPLLRA